MIDIIFWSGKNCELDVFLTVHHEFTIY